MLAVAGDSLGERAVNSIRRIGARDGTYDDMMEVPADKDGGWQRCRPNDEDTFSPRENPRSSR